VARVKNGEVLAYGANLPYGSQITAGEVDLIQAPRSPGSTLKPLLYFQALEEGLVLPYSWLPDAPVAFGSFMPQNYNQQYRGMIPAAHALAKSLNIPAVHLLHKLGVNQFLRFLHQWQFHHANKSAAHYGLSLILGGAECSLWELTQSYAFLGQRAWYQMDSLSGLHLLNNQGKKLSDLEGSPLSAYMVLEAMKEVSAPAPEHFYRNYTAPSRIAWKTGTSYGNKDAWAIGLNSEYVVGVWVGNADGTGRPSLTGIHSAAPILFEVFHGLPEPTIAPQAPSIQVFLESCEKTGFVAGPNCPKPKRIVAPHKGKSVPVCPFHEMGRQDAEETYRLAPGCKPGEGKAYPFLQLPPLEAAYYFSRMPQDRPLPKAPNCGEDRGALMSIRYPVPLTDVLLSESGGYLQIELTHKERDRRIFWHDNDSLLGSTLEPHQMAWKPSEGKHILTLTDDKGHRIQRIFTVYFVHKKLPNTLEIP
jgi:penicillin-binding protein 1C